MHWQDLARAAQAALSQQAWAYFSGGAADEKTMARNGWAWQQWGLVPRVLQNLQGAHTRVQLLDRNWPLPLLVAPMAYQCWAHPQGEQGMALAAAAQSWGMVLSQQTTTPLQTVAACVLNEQDRGPLWFQLHWQPDCAALCRLLSALELAGYDALVLTVDAPVQGVRDRERRANANLPPGLKAVHWTQTKHSSHTGLCAGLAESAAQWQDLPWLIEQTRLPVIVKGITHVDDACRAVAMGAAGIIVSNHGGRVLDTMPATAELLPAIAQAVRAHNATARVLVDGGIRRGTDIFKALALGADAVLVGRAAIYGLAQGGAQGAAKVMRLLRDEFEAAMVLCGCAQIADITPKHLIPLMARASGGAA